MSLARVKNPHVINARHLVEKKYTKDPELIFGCPEIDRKSLDFTKIWPQTIAKVVRIQEFRGLFPNFDIFKLR